MAAGQQVKRVRPVQRVKPMVKRKLSPVAERPKPILKPTATTQQLNDDHIAIPEIPLFYKFLTYLSTLFILPLFGIFQDWRRKFYKIEGEYIPSKDTAHFPDLYQSYDHFFTRNLYARGRDCWNKPICSTPGGKVDLITRVPKHPTFKLKYTYPGTVEKNKTNLASYNYLGFAQPEGPCADASAAAMRCGSVGMASTEQELGRSKLHDELEVLTAKFLGTEDALVFGMGFATNSMNIPCLADKNALIISDELNHASIVTGCRLSSCTKRTFRHNNMQDLENVLRSSILHGNPNRYGKPYNKIIVIVEGIYSMEGTICRLDQIVTLKQKYKFYIYLDEAHSIGALGATGRGCAEYNGVNPKDVDIMMGTFTKSFGAAGGYIGGSYELIRHLRKLSHGSFYAVPMSPPVAAQAKAALHEVGWTEMGQQRIQRLAANARLFKTELRKHGFCIFGDGDSPVIPMLTCEIGKMLTFQRRLIQEGLAVVVVGFPATPIVGSRARFCMSAAHDTEDILKAIEVIKSVGDEIGLRYL